MQYGEDYRESDTQQVKPDGTFSADINVRQPNVAYLIVDKYKVSRLLFLEDGMRATIDASVVPDKDNKEEPYSLQLDYKGDNRDCYEFEQRNDVMSDFA